MPTPMWLLVTLERLLFYVTNIADIAAAIVLLVAAGRLRANPAAARQFNWAGVALMARAIIPLVIHFYEFISSHFMFLFLDEFMRVMVQEIFPNLLVFAAALFVARGIRRLAS